MAPAHPHETRENANMGKTAKITAAFAVLLIAAFSAFAIAPAAAFAESQSPMVFWQKWNVDNHNGVNKLVHYRVDITPGAPIPTGLTPNEDGSYGFTFDGDEETTFYVTPDRPGDFSYRFTCCEPDADGYTYDRTPYTARIYINDEDFANSNPGTTLYYWEDGTKAYDPGWIHRYTTPEDPSGPDKSALLVAIDEGGEIIQGDKPSEAWVELQDAIAEAQVVYDDPNATQEEIDDAERKLRDAIAKFNGSQHGNENANNENANNENENANNNGNSNNENAGNGNANNNRNSNDNKNRNGNYISSGNNENNNDGGILSAFFPGGSTPKLGDIALSLAFVAIPVGLLLIVLLWKRRKDIDGK